MLEREWDECRGETETRPAHGHQVHAEVGLMTALTMKLEQYTALNEAERLRLDRLSAYPAKHLAAGDVILAEGQRVDQIHLVTDGFAARMKSLPDGLTQIVAFMIPGDLCDLEVFVLEHMDHDVVALSPTRCALIPVQAITELMTEVTTLTKALWWSTMTDLAVLRNRLVDQGRREAPERLAHIFYELLIRYRMIGMATDNSYPLPLSQAGLADAAGISAVHANRSLGLLRAERLVELDRGVVRVLNPAGLKRIAGFEADYLHMARTMRPTDVSHRAGDLI